MYRPARESERLSRRAFLVSSAAGAAFASMAHADELPKINNPRATDGDDVFEPDWKERLAITVGPEKAEIVGTSDRAIQAAIDYVTRMGGGTVELLPGTYTLRNAIHLASGLRLRGHGADTILTKIPSQTVKLADDSDWYDQEITLERAEDFRVGDGIVLRAKNPHNGAPVVIKRTLVARSGNRFKLSDGLRENLWLSGEPTCASLFPLLTSEETENVVIEQLTLDGNRANNDLLDGNYAGCIFLQDCRRYAIRDVEARNYNGDGISFQICHDVHVDRCHSHDNANLGMHPGSGSQRPVIRDCVLESNDIGLFWCWGVKHGLAERNRCMGNGSYGVSIGHCDTDNVMRDNEIVGSGKIGVLFRDDARGRDFWPNRNRFEKNRIVDNGGEEGIGIDVTGKPKNLQIVGNVVRETRGPEQRTGIRIGADVGTIRLEDNSIEGFATSMVDARRPAS